MSRFDLDRLRLRRNHRHEDIGRLLRLRKGEHFLKGPVPLRWLEAAARLPGRSLHAGLALWYIAGLTRSPSVPLSNISGDKFGLDRNAKYRALGWLEKAGLVTVERKLGRAPVVTIIVPELEPQSTPAHPD
jgi:hypothetical protein